MAKMVETNWDLLVTGDELDEAAKPRIKEYLEMTVPNSEVEHYLSQGWEIKSEKSKNSVIRKEKHVGDAFEDEVWSVFYNMGFKFMNKNNKFSIAYAPENSLTKQIDVIAIDGETCLIIECKESSKYGQKRNLQKDINEVESYYEKACNIIRSKFPKVKCKCIFATKNITVGEQDKNRMKELKIIHFEYATILYYKALVSHLGSAARYQLLGQLFAGQTIAAMDMKIPAIKGKMGNETYYSFLIAPEKLLKIAYVLHKTNANNEYEDLLPSYQRLIKKERLKSIREFINQPGNFFPNSIVLSIDSKKPLEFQTVSGKYDQDGLAKMGILSLPQKYRSAYIIDGQHRLYGYSGSNYESKNSIPVVAFEKLEKEKQLKLFMDINMNQKPVPKALKNILEIDIYKDSKNPHLAQKSLLGSLAKHLGESSSSALVGRVIIGEDAGTKRCCITLENIKLALEKTKFFNKLKKSGQIIEKGLFDTGDNTRTFEKVYSILAVYFNKIKDEFLEDWNKEDSFFVKNNLIGALIRILDDIIGIAYVKNQSVIENDDLLWSTCSDYMATLLIVLDNLTPEEKEGMVSQRGAKAPYTVYRALEMKMYELNQEFRNEDIENYYVQSYKNYNEEAKPEIVKIREFLCEKIKEMFFESNWMRLYLSEQHENELTNRVASHNNKNERNGINTKVTEWDEINFTDIEKMIGHASNWSKYFKELFSQWIENCNKNDIMSLMKTIAKCNDNIKDGHKITGSDFNEIDRLYKLILGE